MDDLQDEVPPQCIGEWFEGVLPSGREFELPNISDPASSPLIEYACNLFSSQHQEADTPAPDSAFVSDMSDPSGAGNKLASSPTMETVLSIASALLAVDQQEHNFSSTSNSPFEPNSSLPAGNHHTCIPFSSGSPGFEFNGTFSVGNQSACTPSSASLSQNGLNVNPSLTNPRYVSSTTSPCFSSDGSMGSFAPSVPSLLNTFRFGSDIISSRNKSIFIPTPPHTFLSDSNVGIRSNQVHISNNWGTSLFGPNASLSKRKHQSELPRLDHSPFFVSNGILTMRNQPDPLPAIDNNLWHGEIPCGAGILSNQALIPTPDFTLFESNGSFSAGNHQITNPSLGNFPFLISNRDHTLRSPLTKEVQYIAGISNQADIPCSGYMPLFGSSCALSMRNQQPSYPSSGNFPLSSLDGSLLTRNRPACIHAMSNTPGYGVNGSCLQNSLNLLQNTSQVTSIVSNVSLPMRNEVRKSSCMPQSNLSGSWGQQHCVPSSLHVGHVSSHTSKINYNKNDNCVECGAMLYKLQDLGGHWGSHNQVRIKEERITNQPSALHVDAATVQSKFVDNSCSTPNVFTGTSPVLEVKKRKIEESCSSDEASSCPLLKKVMKKEFF